MKISNNCYLVSGLSGPGHWVPIAGFVTGSLKTLVIDTGMTYMSGRTIHGYAQGIKPDNGIVVAVTEPHFDHIGGICFFSEQGIDVFGHKAVNRPEDLIDLAKEELNNQMDNACRKAAHEEEAYYLNSFIANPNRVSEPGDRFNLGGVHVEVVSTPGHTPANLSYRVIEDNVLFCGDAIVTHYLPNLEDGGPKDWKIWLDSLDRIEDIGADIIVPGHGDVITGENIEAAIQRMRSILQKAVDTKKAPTL